MIPGIVAGGGGEFVPPDPNVDPYWADVLLLIDASKHSDAVDPDWADVLLLIDNSEGT